MNTFNHQEAINDEFCMACRNGYIDYIKELVAKHGQININCDDGYGLRKACSFGHFELVKYLVNLPEFDPLHLEQGLMSACEKGRVETINYLLKNTSLKTTLTEFSSEFAVAAIYKNKEAMEYFLYEQKLTLNIRDPKDLKKYLDIDTDSYQFMIKLIEKRDFTLKLENELIEKAGHSKNKI